MSVKLMLKQEFVSNCKWEFVLLKYSRPPISARDTVQIRLAAQKLAIFNKVN